MSDGFDPGGTDPEAMARAIGLMKTLSHQGRLEILCRLLERDMNVGDLATAMGEPQAAVSQQLMRLRAEGIVRPHREGKHMVYQLAIPEVASVIAALRGAFCQSL